MYVVVVHSLTKTVVVPLRCNVTFLEEVGHKFGRLDPEEDNL